MSGITFRPDTFGLSESLGMSGEGPTARRRRTEANPAMRRAVLEAKALITDAWAGDRAATVRVNEAITTSDLFRSATGEFLDIELLRNYQLVEKQWTKFATRTTVRNFRPKSLRSLVAGTSGFAKVPEHTPYPEASDVDIAESLMRVGKFGEAVGYTWEARLNDEIGELAAVPGSWANKAAFTEDDTALETLADPVTGAPNTGFFNAGNGNLGTGALTADRLQAAIIAVTTKRDKNGRLLRAPSIQLVVGPGLQFGAERILNTQWIRYTDGDGNVVEQSNPFAGKVKLTVLANLPGSAWFLLPGSDSPRPAFYVGFLAGYETPDMRFAADQGQSMGGGALPSDAGSFEDDTIYYRVRHVVGATTGDPLFTYASDGVGA